jgi:hypothetical protein
MATWVAERSSSEFVVRRTDLGLPPIYFSSQPAEALVVRDVDDIESLFPKLPTKVVMSANMNRGWKEINYVFMEVSSYIAMQASFLSSVDTIAYIVSMSYRRQSSIYDSAR